MFTMLKNVHGCIYGHSHNIIRLKIVKTDSLRVTTIYENTLIYTVWPKWLHNIMHITNTVYTK